MTWWYFSTSNLGAAVVEGATRADALANLANLLRSTTVLDVRGVELPGDPPAKFRGRLLTREEAIGPELATWGKQATRRIFRPGADTIGRRRRRRRRRRT